MLFLVKILSHSFIVIIGILLNKHIFVHFLGCINAQFTIFCSYNIVLNKFSGLFDGVCFPRLSLVGCKLNNGNFAYFTEKWVISVSCSQV